MQGTAGTVLYMAAELLLGEMATVSSDVYALGVLAWQLFAQTRPFAGINRRADMFQPCGDIEVTAAGDGGGVEGWL